MSKYLVIVESPTKARTIFTILGKDYEVFSSMGHIVDLPPDKLAVEVDRGFKPSYKVIPGKEKILSQLKKKAKNKEIIYLATDPDREGEAISWHIKERLSGDSKLFYRIIFHEITEEALKEALANPTSLDMNKVNAQTARRVLDRIVGYYLSPLLWKKVVRGLSAGRVQSVALKFIVEREKEIKNFKPKITYTIEAKFKTGEFEFTAKLEKYKGKKAVFETREEAQRVIENIEKEKFYVKEITKKEIKRKPPPPYTTSLLQQDAFTKLRFSSQKTMLVAQRLYEGVQIKDKRIGLITYMRTDSFYIAPKAKKEVKGFIKRELGQDFLALREYRYKEKKGAQLAHEAIRPTSVWRIPQEIESFLSSDEKKLYELIWKRFVAFFMKEMILETTKVFLASENAEFIAEGRRLLFEGYTKILGRTEEEKILPSFKKEDKILLCGCDIVQHTTKPPSRFNDASLVKILEEKGIGRPSTYAPTISTLLMRNYIRREKGVFLPTELGIKVCELLVKYFPEIINENFTAFMEERLDEVEEGKVDWRKILEDFYPSFKKKIDEANNIIKKEVDYSDKVCPKCNSRLVIKWSKKGKFLSCANFPRCRYGESITTDITCPQCRKGKLIERRNKRGQVFFGCTEFPECRFTTRELPKEGDTLE
jgi:DNA topoisomerase-1